MIRMDRHRLRRCQQCVQACRDQQSSPPPVLIVFSLFLSPAVVTGGPVWSPSPSGCLVNIPVRRRPGTWRCPTLVQHHLLHLLHRHLQPNLTVRTHTHTHTHTRICTLVDIIHFLVPERGSNPNPDVLPSKNT